jgi:hypothetical protein
MSSRAKTAQLQIRVSTAEKAAIQRAAKQAGVDMSTYVLERMLSIPAARFQQCMVAVAGPKPSFGLAELNSLLTGALANELRAAVAAAPEISLSPYIANYVAAMVELACERRAIAIPHWRTGIWEPASQLAPLPFDPVACRLSPSQYLHRLDSRLPGVRRVEFTRADIERLFQLLNDELAGSGIRGELYLVGGAVMCLAYGARASTRDVDAAFRPSAGVRKAAARVAAQVGIEPQWLNDGVKAFMSERGDFALFLELDHLRVMLAQPTYLLAMKCMAMRIGDEFHDQDDVRYLLRLLDVRSYDQAINIVTKYYPLDEFPQKTLYALTDLLPMPD